MPIVYFTITHKVIQDQLLGLGAAQEISKAEEKRQAITLKGAENKE